MACTGFLTEDSDKWRAFFNTVVDLRVPLNEVISPLTENLVTAQEGLRSILLDRVCRSIHAHTPI
jgi:hypothetical protein